MPIQILIAENNPGTLNDTKQALEKKKFETVLATTPDEAKQIIFENNPLLGAMVIDKRLIDDDNPKDQSGVNLALEAQTRSLAKAPIILFSTFGPSAQSGPVSLEQEHAGYVPQITELSKGDGFDALIETIVRQIHSQLREIPNLEDIPRYHQPPILMYSANNGIEQIARELKKSGISPGNLPRIEDLTTAKAIYPSALFAINVADENGIEAIKLLTRNGDIPRKNFYIVALTSDDRLREPISQAGVNTTVIRQSPEADARELVLLMSLYKAEIAEKQVKGGTPHLYQQLLAQLQNMKSGGDVSSSLDTIERTLNWPFPTANEKLILVTLHTRLLRAAENNLDAETMALCIEGASMLERNQTGDEEVQDWIERTAQKSADFTFAWVDDETFSGDAEDDD